MAKIINISDKLSFDKPCIQVGEKSYPVNDSLETVMKFEEVYGDGDIKSMLECLKVALGQAAYEELDFEKMSSIDDNIYCFYYSTSKTYRSIGQYL